MADNTTINVGTGGDTLRTDDVGSGIKVPVSKIITGGDGVDGGFVSSANPFPSTLISGSQTGILVGANPAAVSNPLPVQAISGSQTGILMGANPVAASNPLAVTSISGSQIGILVGANPAAQSNPLPTRPMSGSQTGILMGANPVALSNPFAVQPVGDQSGQILSGTTTRVVNYAQGNFATSGSNAVVAAQGANNRIRVLSAHVMADNTVLARWLSAGTQVAPRNSLSAAGGYVLPYNPHGWFQTAANEALNIDLSAAVNVGVVITWIMVGNP